MLRNGERATFCVRVRFNEAVDRPVLLVALQNSARVPLFTVSSGWQDDAPGHVRGGRGRSSGA